MKKKKLQYHPRGIFEGENFLERLSLLCVLIMLTPIVALCWVYLQISKLWEK